MRLLQTTFLLTASTAAGCLASDGADPVYDPSSDGKADGTNTVHWDVPTYSTAELVIGGATGGATPPPAAVAAAAELVVSHTLPSGPADVSFGWMVGSGGLQKPGFPESCNTDRFDWRHPNSADNNLAWPTPGTGPLVVKMTNSGQYPVNLLLQPSSAVAKWGAPVVGLVQPIRIKAGVQHAHTRVYATTFGPPDEEDFLVLAPGETLAIRLPALSAADTYFRGWTQEPNGRAYFPALEVMCKGRTAGLHFVYAARQHLDYGHR